MSQKFTHHQDQAVITVKEARKIMGKDAHGLSDDQIQKLINDLDLLAMLVFEMVPTNSIK